MQEEKRVSKKVKRKPMDMGLLVVTLILLSLGVIMVLSASAPSAFRLEGDSYYYFKRQAIFAVAGVVVMLFVSKIDYKIYSSKIISRGLLCIAFVLLLLVFVPSIGITINDATRWIKIAGVQFQPSEIMKVALIIFMSATIAENPKKLNNFWAGFVPYLVLIGAIGGLLLLEPHMSATVIMVMIAGAILLVGGVKLGYILPFVPIAAIAGYILSKVSEYRWKRVIIFMDPWQDKLGDGWQIIQSLYALGNGGLFGVGLGQSTQKYMYIPEPHNDFIASIYAEELGLIGITFLMILFGIFIWRGIMISAKAPDLFGALLAIGITVMIGIQAVFSLAVVSSSMPVTGIPLPFFSYGGTALLILLSCVGILLNISRKSKM